MNSLTSNNQQPKQLPYNVTRGKIFDTYSHLNPAVVRKSLDVITQEYCKTTKIPFVRFKNIPRPVWVEFIKVQGFPAGYKHEVEWLEEKTF